MKLYPIGIQDFRKIREEGFIYVDKTRHIYDILQSGSYYFLARPRRFGKSLTLSTIKEYYSGDASLFQGLWIENKWDFPEQERKVIWLKLAILDYQTFGLAAALQKEINRIAEEFGITLAGGSMKADFASLIREAGKDKKAVLLIDEYDKPITDYLDDPKKVAENQAVMKLFYSVIKDSDPFLELVFITGVAAFSKVSIFSDLNNISNISLEPLTHTLLGITEKEIQTYFSEEMGEEDADLVRKWYNGYSWGGEERVYNPFSLLRFLKSRQFSNYWFETGTPTFLVKLVRDNKLYDLKNTKAAQMVLSSLNIVDPSPIPLLFQTGYLTVVKYDRMLNRYTLDYPNVEVRQAFNQLLFGAYLNEPNGMPAIRVFDLYDAFHEDDLDTVFSVINSTFADLPYDFWHRDDEHFFHALIHLLFNLLGVHIQSEVHTLKGRCDAIVQTGTHVYAFEFKRDASVELALRQIKEKGYLTPFTSGTRLPVAIGVNFDSESKQVADWKAVPQA